MYEIWNSLMKAISAYSRIPTPRISFEKGSGRYAMAFFPLVGAGIGVLSCGWFWCCRYFELPSAARALTAAVLPILITGGIHIDGFLDTSDALHSYQTRERKLEILKDPHIGAFAAICLLTYGALYAAALFCIGEAAEPLWCGSFVLARILSGLSVCRFRNARGDGMLYAFSEGTDRRTTTALLAAELAVCAAWMIAYSLRGGVTVLLAAGGVFRYCRRRAYREFGGITGDVAGWFLCLCELWIALALAALTVGGLL